MKKRILFLTEATYLNTGYATYSKEVMDRVFKSGKYEIAELSMYGSVDEPRRKTIPWKNYPNLPSQSDPKELHDQYNSNPVNQFGAWRFERTCADFKPDIVVSIRDFWMDSFVKNSPYRKCFKWTWMPTVDSEPQNEEWINYMTDCDAVTTYSDWAINVIKRQCGEKANIKYSTPPAASSLFKPVEDKRLHKEKMGINPNDKVIGFVSRNQRRKLFPELFEGFGKFLNETGRTDVYLYCHTSYPDNGWDLAKLLLRNEISSKVLFTYVCQNCNHVEICKFSDSLQECSKCKHFASKPSNVSCGVSTEQLSDIYNCFDLYVQCANSEGFGIGQVEAASCGVPVAAVDYSAMSDIVRKLNGYPIALKATYEELETGCFRAIPDTDHMATIFTQFFSLSEDEVKREQNRVLAGYSENYNWDTTSEKWMKIFDELPSGSWNLPIIKTPIPENFPENTTNYQFLEWAFSVMLPEINAVGSYEFSTLLRDLNFQAFKNSPGGFFYSENSFYGREAYQPLEKKIVFDMIRNKAKSRNFWEDIRSGSIIFNNKENWID